VHYSSDPQNAEAWVEEDRKPRALITPADPKDAR
jgi:hypothetical protein